MSALLNRLFVSHPKSVDESYFEHMFFAGWFAAQLALAAAAALVHAVIPGMFEKTASTIITRLHHRMQNRR